jgi:hypothetical protein
MDTPGSFTIVIGTQMTANRLCFERLALRIAQNLYTYFGAEVDIRFDYEVDDLSLDGNVISLGMEDENVYLQSVEASRSLMRPFPITTKTGAIYVNDTMAGHTYRGNGVGAIYLHPLRRSRLLMVICGVDQKGLELAAKLFPYRTGVGQPDWIIVGSKMGNEGMRGVEAMGYYSNLWDVELPVSYFS